MERRPLGRTELELSVIGLGTWVFGGRWGGADDECSLAACHAALDAGVNWIDTADIYGQGRAERIVGKAVRERRDEVIVATKAGVAWELEESGLRIWRDASADYLRMAVDRSLLALGLDHIDLHQVHWPVTGTPAEETMGAMLDLRAAGKIREIGVSNYGADDLQAALSALEGAGEGSRSGGSAPLAPAALASYQAGYHLMRREIEAAELPWCAANAVGVLAYGPLAHGLLTGKMDETTRFPASDWRASSELFADDAFPERVAVVRELAGIADQAGRPGGVAELAVVWTLRRPEVTAAIIGARDADQATRNAALAGSPLSADEESAIEAVLARHPQASRHYGHGEPPDPARAGESR